MLIQPTICPICENVIGDRDNRCSRCRCVVQCTLDPPIFSRAEIEETLVQPTLDRCRAQISANPQGGITHYVLGLCYLNYALVDQGIEELQQAAALLPERHTIRFELALLHSVPGKYAAGLEQIGQAIKAEPGNRDYQYLQHYLAGMVAQARREYRSAVLAVITAYQLTPDARLAVDALTQFIAAHQAKLTQPIARSLLGLDQHDAKALQTLNSDPAAQKHTLPSAPKAPGELRKVSMNLLRKVSPLRATAIEQMHAERITAYQAATETHNAHYQMVVEQREATIRDWQGCAQAIRSDLPTMARLCLAVVEEEERRRLEEERRQAEAERRRQEAEQKRLAAQQLRTQAQATAKVREKQYLVTQARYIQGLPVGKEKDSIILTVTNLKITAKHSAMMGAWEHTIPMTSLTEVTADTVKHLLSSEKRLRISYQDGRGMDAHAILANLRVDDCVKNILKARSGT